MAGKKSPRLTLIKGGLDKTDINDRSPRAAALQRWVEQHCPRLVKELKALCRQHPAMHEGSLDPNTFYSMMIAEAFDIYKSTDYAHARRWLIDKIAAMKAEMEDASLFVPDACRDTP